MISRNTLEFVSSKLNKIEGWLYDDCVFVTAGIMKTMKKLGVSGPNFEIGVWKGKYLAAMHHCAREYNDPQTKSYGIDFFQWCDKNDHIRAFEEAFGTSRDVKVVEMDSLKSRGDDIVAICGGEQPAFISVDGDHTVWPVLNDHVICADALRKGGVMASDDVCNWAMIGLIDGLARFYFTNNRHDIVPFAYCSNKLFSCHRDHHAAYLQGMVEFCEANPDLAPAQRFLNARQSGPWHVKQELFGATCLVI